MTVLEVILTLALLFTVPGVVWLAVDTWALRRDVNRLDAALEDAHDTTSDLDVPHMDNHPDTTRRPAPADFNTNR